MQTNFNPRSPCGERLYAPLSSPGSEISIHAPRVGSDARIDNSIGVQRHFNPRSPCGERLTICGTVRVGAIFQSTLPVWGATRDLEECSDSVKFQSTLPLRGATRQSLGADSG